MRNKDFSLSVIGIDKARDYPVKCIEIREVADVEYIPLEAVSSSLLINDIWGYYVFYLSLIHI